MPICPVSDRKRNVTVQRNGTPKQASCNLPYRRPCSCHVPNPPMNGDARGYGRTVTYEFDLVPEQGAIRFDDGGFENVSYLLCEFQPASRVMLVGSPPSRIRVALGTPADLAPASLPRSRRSPEQHCGTSLAD